MPTGTPPMKSVQRAFEIVQALWELREAGPSKIADHLGLSKSSAHVYLRSLQSTGYVVNDAGKYRLSYKFLMTGSRLKYRSRLFQISQDEMQTLSAETGELVALFIEEMDQLVLIHQEMGEQSLELGTYPGMMLPLHSHASGKIFLAHMSPERTEEIIKGELTKVTEQTITEKAPLLDELTQIREDRYAYDWDQQIEGMGVIAVPIVVNDDLKAALSIACPTGQLQNNAYRNELRQRLQGTAETLVIKYQYGN